MIGNIKRCKSIIRTMLWQIENITVKFLSLFLFFILDCRRNRELCNVPVLIIIYSNLLFTLTSLRVNKETTHTQQRNRQIQKTNINNRDIHYNNQLTFYRERKRINLCIFSLFKYIHMNTYSMSLSLSLSLCPSPCVPFSVFLLLYRKCIFKKSDSGTMRYWIMQMWVRIYSRLTQCLLSHKLCCRLATLALSLILFFCLFFKIKFFLKFIPFFCTLTHFHFCSFIPPTHRLTVTSSCPMNLQYFPMDSQLCTIEIESCK